MATEEYEGAVNAASEAINEQNLSPEEKAKRQQIQADIRVWKARVKRAATIDEYWVKSWELDRSFAAGHYDSSKVNANLIAAIMEVLLAYLYARNPDLNVTLSETAESPELAYSPMLDDSPEAQAKRQQEAAIVQNYRKLAKTLEIVVSRLLRDAHLKKVAKRWNRSAMTVGPAWIKAAMQRRLEKDPVMQKSINDLKEQLDRIKAKQIEIEELDGDPDEIAATIEDNIKAAEAHMERMVATGMLLDFYRPEHIKLAPECESAEAYLTSPWIAIETYKSKTDALAITGWTGEQAKYLDHAKVFYETRLLPGAQSQDGKQYVEKTDLDRMDPDRDESSGFVKFIEIWSRVDGVVKTMIEGCNDAWARDSYAPITGQRFYPLFLLGFHFIEGQRYPQSDVTMLRSLQEEYTNTRTDFRNHRERARPGLVFDETRIDPNSIRKLSGSDTQEYIGVKLLNPEDKVSDVVTPKMYNPIDPALYDTLPITREMEKISGVQDAQQSSISVEKTATEAKILEGGFGARTGARRDELEDVLTELSEYTAQLALQTMDQADAIRYAGPGAVWIQMSAEEALTLFQFEIKAGSTGKPKATSDREAWATLLPLLLDLVKQIGAARISGQEWAAKPLIALLLETMHRLDDHADLQSFLPQVPEQVVQQAKAESGKGKEKTESDLNIARMLKELATAIEKVPAIAELPETQELLGIINPQGAAAPIVQ